MVQNQWKGSAYMIRFLFSLKQISDKFSQDEISVYAAQASFFIILAAFPFLMLLLALIQLVPMVHKSDLMSILVHIAPESLDGLILTVVDSLYSDSPVTLLSATAITSLWSASKGMLSIERGLNRVYGISTKRNYLLRRIICSGYTILFSLACVLSLVLLVFGGMLQKQIGSWFPRLGQLSFLISPARTLILFVFLMLFFLAVYIVLPFKKQALKSQLPGAVFASAGWGLFSFAFSIYFRYFSSYTLMYGSLTAIILFMLWLYFCICILFLGAEINWFYKSHILRT